MTREHAKELLPIITAFANGEDVEFHRLDVGWTTIVSPSFDSEPANYRIAPKPRKVWVNEYPHGELRMHPSKEAAEERASGDRIACHELELPPLA